MEHSQFFIGLRKLFEKFPGIGPRQANRFIWAMLDFAPDEQKSLGEAILALPSRIRRCNTCFRVFPVSDSEKTCSFCLPSSKRDHTILMVIERDSDLLNIEKAAIYRGLFHVLGGPLDPLQEHSIVRDRIKALYERLEQAHQNNSKGKPPPNPLLKKEGEGWGDSHSSSIKLKSTSIEVILALSPTKMGEFTAHYIQKILEPLTNGGHSVSAIRITRLGRGLATGMELEYADELTLKQALDNRK